MFRKSLIFLAAVIFCASLKCAADDSEHLGAMGVGAFQKKNYHQAIEYFSQAAGVNSNYVGAYYYRGLSYLALKQYDLSIADMSRALALNTNNAEAYYFRGLAYSDENKYNLVIADMDSALSLNTNILYLLGRAFAYLQVTNYNGAIEDYSHVIRLHPLGVEAYLGRARVYRLEKVLGLAMMDCSTALEINPTSPEAYRERGAVYHDEGDYHAAIADYDESLQLDPEDKSGYFLKALTLSDMGDYSNAIANLTTYLKFNPEDAEAYDNRGWCRTELGDYQGALSDSRRAIALDPKSPEAYNNFAWLLAVCPDARFRNGPQAVEYAKKSCALGNWQDPSCIDTLAAAYAEAGDFREAIKWEKQALKSMPAEDLAESRKALRGYEQHQPYRELPKTMQKPVNASAPPAGSSDQ
jgi:tetratricopeptide (TPR) repeat protein